MNESHEPNGNIQLSDDLKRLEAELARLRPRDDRLNRERLIFLAGQASVAGATDCQRTVLGVNLTSRAWPAAFAAMTAAAIMLCVLFATRPEKVIMQSSSVTGTERSDKPHTPTPRRDELMLSTIDAHRGDADRLFSHKEFFHSDVDETILTPVENHDISILTPASWKQVLHESQSSVPSSNDTSSHFLERGATS